MLPKRPESEEMIGENDDETDEHAVRRAVLTGCRTAKGDGYDGLGQVQEEILHRDPEHQPHEENEGIGKNDGEERGSAAGTLKDIGEGGKGGEGGERGASLRGDESEGSEEELHHGEDGRGQLEEDDENGEDVPQGAGRENGGGHGEHTGRVARVAIGSRGALDGGGVKGTGAVVRAAGLHGIERHVGASAGALVGGRARRSSNRSRGSVWSHGLLDVGGLVRLRREIIYEGCGRRRRRRRFPIGEGMEVRVAPLLGDALSDGCCEAILVFRLAPLAFRYHVRGRQRAESADTPGRARLGVRRALLGGIAGEAVVGGEVYGRVVDGGGGGVEKTRHNCCRAKARLSSPRFDSAAAREWCVCVCPCLWQLAVPRFAAL